MAENSIYRVLLFGPKKSSELIEELKISQPTFSRLIQKSIREDKVQAFGKNKGAIYGIPREVTKAGSRFPLFKITETGEAKLLGEITAVVPRGYVLNPIKGKPEIFPGIPFYLSDARPQGYLGRAFVSRNSDLGFPHRLNDWSEDQVFCSLVLRGEHLPGNLLVGEESFKRLESENGVEEIPKKLREKKYRELSLLSITGSVPGSSAAGEQPKFSAYLEGKKHVLVKFSSSLKSPKGRRWGDLLIAESIALNIVKENLSISVAESEIIEGEEEIYLESTRFDRSGEKGRLGCISFSAVEAEWIGKPSVWAASAKELLRMKKISKADAEAIQLLDAFGAWIANSDRHYGNLSFFYEPGDEKVRLAPLYDMLPMFFAPKETEDAEFNREWKVPALHPDWVPVWGRAREAAVLFWNKVIEDKRISSGFRAEAQVVLDLAKKK